MIQIQLSKPVRWQGIASHGEDIEVHAMQKIDPLNKQVERALRKWQALDKSVMQDSSLSLLFRSICAGNTSLGEVLLKVSVLNDFYSTNIYDTFAVASHIHSQNVDTSLERGDLGVVERIANVTFNGRARRIYSFATKYCSHHASEKFPIYDRYVDEMLWHFKARDGFTKFKRSDLKDYPSFVGIMDTFREAYGLAKYTRKEIDVFLWLAGKDRLGKVVRG